LSTLTELNVSAKFYEEKYLPKPITYYPHFHTKPQTPNSSLPVSQSLKSIHLLPLLLLIPTTLTTMTNQRNTNIKRMISAEMHKENEENGLCFTCDYNFSPTHRFGNKQYLLLHLKDDDNTDIQPYFA